MHAMDTGNDDSAMASSSSSSKTEIWDFGKDGKENVVTTTMASVVAIDGDVANAANRQTGYKLVNLSDSSAVAAGGDPNITINGQSAERPKVLYVRDRYAVDTGESFDKCFADQRFVGAFRIDGQQRYDDNNCRPNLIQLDTDMEQIAKRNVNLMDGFENSSLIVDYKSYKQLKWKYFLQWIRRSQYLENRPANQLPEFVSFGGLYTSMLMTPNHIEDWTLLIAKYKNTIYMNKIRFDEDNNRFGGRYKSRRDEFSDNLGSPVDNKSFTNNITYLATKVTQIITNGDKQAINTAINEYEKYFKCYETNIGVHRLLLMSEIDAIDEEDNYYDIKCSKSTAFGQKLLNWWAGCVVADIDYILVGIQDNNNVLKQIDKMAVREIPDLPRFRWNCDEAYDFVNRILNYIKELMKDAEDLDTYKVYFRKRDRNCVRSAKQPINGLLPVWFTSGTEVTAELAETATTDH
ncbi:uncharacterized protein LOC128954777 [Oppia nitens]|uniref:uncharacterized protein LOC128954777 n=1 Tax=Oppia nitens TaxID=1686743 RepID=UPI0023DBEE7E|nr:uncharacterized protein LOC128954777 [Oppia nitens]